MRTSGFSRRPVTVNATVIGETSEGVPILCRKIDVGFAGDPITTEVDFFPHLLQQERARTVLFTATAEAMRLTSLHVLTRIAVHLMPGAFLGGTRMPTPTILSLGEFLKLRGKQKNPVLVYFDKQQWANLTRGLKPTDEKPPRRGVTLALTALPGREGGFVEIRCPVGGPITGAEGELRCGDPPDVEIPDPETPTLRMCGMTLLKDGNVRCTGKCKGLASCRKKMYGTSFGPQGSFSAVLVLCQCL